MRRCAAGLGLCVVCACSSNDYRGDRSGAPTIGPNCPESPERESCNGIDDDCDGWPDAYRVGSERLSACVCERRPVLVSAFDNGSSEDARATTQCNIEGASLTIETELKCDGQNYVLCTAPATDGMDFDLNQGAQTLLEIAFELRSDSPLPGALNLWLQEPSSREIRARKYLPLLQAEAAPGSYVRRFSAEAECFPTWMGKEYACSGAQHDACGACAKVDSCGRGASACDQFDFSKPELQLALEPCAGDTTFAATIRVTELAYLSLGCVHEAAP